MLIRPTSLAAWLLRLEGAATCAAAIALYFNQSGRWWLFLALILAPDLSMLGYLAGHRLTVFAAYCFVLAIVGLLVTWING